MKAAQRKAKAREALSGVELAESALQRSDRECSGGICIWHRFSPQDMGVISSRLIDARYALNELLADPDDGTDG